MAAIAPGFFFPPCVTLLGMAWLSMLGSISKLYASSGFIFELVWPRPGTGAGGEADPCDARWARCAIPGVGGGDEGSNMLRTGGVEENMELDGDVIPMVVPAMEACLPVEE
jgi:hypothetical protein